MLPEISQTLYIYFRLQTRNAVSCSRRRLKLFPTVSARARLFIHLLFFLSALARETVSLSSIFYLGLNFFFLLFGRSAFLFLSFVGGLAAERRDFRRDGFLRLYRERGEVFHFSFLTFFIHTHTERGSEASYAFFAVWQKDYILRARGPFFPPFFKSIVLDIIRRGVNKFPVLMNPGDLCVEPNGF